MRPGCRSSPIPDASSVTNSNLEMPVASIDARRGALEAYAEKAGEAITVAGVVRTYVQATFDLAKTGGEGRALHPCEQPGHVHHEMP